MKIVYFSNFLNHHQALVADELYRVTGGQYYFVETLPMYEWLQKGGYSDFSSRPYVIQAWKDSLSKEKAKQLCIEADVALFACPQVLPYEILRAKLKKLSFEVGERWLKKGIVNIFSPHLLKNMWYYHTVFKHAPFYKLCASAFCAKDQYILRSYKDKCYKWGYFTKFDESFDIELELNKKTSGAVKLMWCSRFLSWKHPDLPVKMASILKSKGYTFSLDMFGSGVEFEKIKKLAKDLHINDIINFMGNLPNEEILKEMRKYSIFLFTSDKNEGWGAVANEAMSNGCALIASDAIGSVPFLVEDGENGCVFKSCDVNSLTEKVEFLLNNPNECKRLSLNGYNTIKKIWSPKNAANNFIQLVLDLQNGKDTTLMVGPCSKVIPL